MRGVCERVREINTALSAREASWASRVWETREAVIDRVVSALGLTEYSSGDGAFTGTPGVSRSVSALQLASRVARGAGFKTWESEVFGDGCTLRCTHSAHNSWVWMPVFYHPRGDRAVDSHDISGMSWMDSLPGEADLDMLRDSPRDDLVRVELYFRSLSLSVIQAGRTLRETLSSLPRTVETL